jgi:molybdopterin-guanine dinucleotide biosynthesis protein A
MTQASDITAVILAGGKGRRMQGQDKGLLELNGKLLIQHVISAIAPQVGQLVINANRNLQQYASLGYPIISDSLEDYQGPLAGFLATMNSISTPDMVSVPCDGPLLPHDLVERLVVGREQAAADIAVAHDGQRLQPVYTLMPTRLKQDLAVFLESGGRKIDLWFVRHHVVHVDFSDMPEAFININTPQDRNKLQQQEETS